MAANPAYQRTQPQHFRHENERGDRILGLSNVTYHAGGIRLNLPSNCVPALRNTTDYGDPEFINDVVRAVDLNLALSMPDWQYEKRQTAQEILPFLLLGPMSFARDPDQVRKAGITMLVAVRSKKAASKTPNMMNPARYSSSVGLQTAVFDVDTAYDVRTGRHAIIKAINDHLLASCGGRKVQNPNDIPGKVLIFCETGNERSPVLVAMYLMVMWGLDGISACHLVQARRFGVGIPSEMVGMLASLGDFFETERNVAKTLSEENQPDLQVADRKKMKRNIDMIYDMGVDMGGGSDLMTMEALRPGNAPFIDKPTN